MILIVGATRKTGSTDLLTIKDAIDTRKEPVIRTNINIKSQKTDLPL